MKKEEVLINILTRTSNRPNGFYNCRQSILKQTYRNIKHFVSYENDADLSYLEDNEVTRVKVEKYKGKRLLNSEGHIHAPYNLYCNALMKHVDTGWILFLDDDDHLLHNKVIQEIVTEINETCEDTMFIWQMRYPNGKLLPTEKHFKDKKVEFMKIGSPCFLFHSKYKSYAQWDQWKASDYRVIKGLYKKLPDIKWIEKVRVQLNNYGDFGNRNDMVKDVVTHKLIFNKTWFWFLIPKYHTKINAIYIFQTKTYKQYWRRGVKKLKKILKIT